MDDGTDDAEAWLLAALDYEYPEPVDVFEDAMAQHLGLQKHPALSREDWRRLRVQFIEAFEQHADAADLARLQRAEDLAAEAADACCGRQSDPPASRGAAPEVAVPSPLIPTRRLF